MTDLTRPTDMLARDRRPTTRLMATLLAVALLGSACANSSETSNPADVDLTNTGSSTESEGAGSATEPSDVISALESSDLAIGEWATEVISSYEQLQLGRSEAAAGWIEQSMADGDEIEKAVEFLETEQEVMSGFLAALPGVPTVEDGVSDRYTALVLSASAISESNDSLLAIVQADPDGIRAAVAAAGDPGPTEYGQAFSAHWALDDDLLAACSELQADLADYGVLDCAGSSVEEGDVAEASGIDPTTTATGLVEFAALPPGTHDFEVFDPGFVVETDSEVLVQTGPDFLVFRDAEDDGIEFWVFAGDEWADPNSLAGPEDNFAGVAIPVDDIDGYLARLPVTVEDTGTVDYGGDAVPYWDVRVDEVAAAEVLEFPEFPMLRLGSDPDAPIVLLFAGATHRILLLDIDGARPLTVWYLSWEEAQMEANATHFASVMRNVD